MPKVESFPRWFFDTLLVLAICLASVEGSLRLQQAIGPFYDLELRDVNLDWYSDELNHRAGPHSTVRFVGKEIFGSRDGFTFSVAYDELGIRQPVNRISSEGCKTDVRLLFLGDSFIEGYDDANTVPNRVAESLMREHRICSTAFNAGLASYSPAILIPLARKLMPTVRADYVVIDIDETDLVDDVYRYEPLVVHDTQGGLIA